MRNWKVIPKLWEMHMTGEVMTSMWLEIYYLLENYLNLSLHCSKKTNKQKNPAQLGIYKLRVKYLLGLWSFLRYMRFPSSWLTHGDFVPFINI